VAAEEVQKLKGCLFLSKVRACKVVERLQRHGGVGGLRHVIKEHVIQPLMRDTSACWCTSLHTSPPIHATSVVRQAAVYCRHRNVDSLT
jgi:hypothetical protein